MARTTTGKAKVLSNKQVTQIMRELTTNRDRVMFLLSVKAGLRSMEIAGIRWRHVRDTMLELTADICKKGKARDVPISADLMAALIDYRAEVDPNEDDLLFYNRHLKTRRQMTANSIAQWFRYLYRDRMEWDGQYSSHSGRRTFITNAARKITQVGGSVKDVQEMAGHSDLKTTQGYIEGSSDAKKKVVDLI